ncbi:hypothetical protein [Candidatus Poriferisocius sp.]|uniref:hypothetical protein n=1 Tax=Candidatus Poriferisocius sp. TaxID=3101276 RepID=UPI003B51A99F
MTDQNDLIERWVEALRSGDYQQGIRFLRNTNDNYCCLGVLCDLVDPKGWGPPREEWVGHTGSASTPSPEVGGVLEEAIEGSGWETEDLCYQLMKANDKLFWDFDKIADFLEKELL